MPRPGRVSAYFIEAPVGEFASEGVRPAIPIPRNEAVGEEGEGHGAASRSEAQPGNDPARRAGVLNRQEGRAYIR